MSGFPLIDDINTVLREAEQIEQFQPDVVGGVNNVTDGEDLVCYDTDIGVATTPGEDRYDNFLLFKQIVVATMIGSYITALSILIFF